MSKSKTTLLNIDFERSNIRSYDLASSPSQGPRSQKSSLVCLHGQRPIDVRDHCHYPRSEGVDVKARRKLIITSALCVVLMLGEIVGGILSNSLAVALDAAHLLVDFSSFMIALFAIWVAGRPPTRRLTFGWYRAEIMGALFSIFLIWFLTAILIWLAIRRLMSHDFEIDGKVMLITASLAMIVNLIMALQIQYGNLSCKCNGNKMEGIEIKSEEPSGSSKKSTSLLESNSRMTQTNREDKLDTSSEEAHIEEPVKKLRNSFSIESQGGVSLPDAPIGHQFVNLTVRAAFLNALGDMIQSLGVFIAGLIIYFQPGWSIADPITTFFFAFVVLFSTFGVMGDALLVLMESTPSYLQYTDVLKSFEAIEDVQCVHNMHIWALNVNKIVCTVHLAIRPGADPRRILEEANSTVHRRFGFYETAIQVEELTEEKDHYHQCGLPQK